MIEGDGSLRQIEKVKQDHAEQKTALDSLRPLEIREERFAVDPNKGQIQGRKRDIEDVDKNADSDDEF
ncbi:MAG TPA: hypothetical protein DCP63_00170 [Bacteroidetes bacterium]|nr:hypothetical protein [Bacteroidota bacterium]